MSLRNNRWRDVYKVLTKHGFSVDRQRGDQKTLFSRDNRYDFILAF